MAQVSIGSLGDFEEGTPTFAEADGTRLCVVRVGDTVHAICDDCPHAEASLSEGDFLADDMAVECPLHGSAFNIVTGNPDVPPATEAVRVFPVTVDGDDVLVEV
ncbi:MAG: non-heme iron oxygenase ferredoxin subunit [Gaiellales bacterium]